jgi:hypothetical protein
VIATTPFGLCSLIATLGTSDKKRYKSCESLLFFVPNPWFILFVSQSDSYYFFVPTSRSENKPKGFIVGTKRGWNKEDNKASQTKGRKQRRHNFVLKKIKSA